MGLTHTLNLALPHFQAFLVLISRIGGLLAALPVFSGRTVPMKVKLALVLVLGVLLAPVIPLPSVSLDPMLLAGGLLSEMTIGMTIGLAVRLLFGGDAAQGHKTGVLLGGTLSYMEASMQELT